MANEFIVKNGMISNGDIDLNTLTTDEYKIGGNRAIAMPLVNSNIAIGDAAGGNLSSGAIQNTLVGQNAGAALTTGINIVAIGTNACPAITTGSSVVSIGSASLLVVTGAQNIAVGQQTGQLITTGTDNIIIGHKGMNQTATGVARNISIGTDAANGIITNDNIAIGYRAMWDAVPSNAGNIAIGKTAANALTGGGTTVVGYQAMTQASLAGSNNSVFGYQAGWTMGTGGDNSLFGYQAGYSLATGDGNIFLGYQAGYNETGSNKLYIENSNSASPLIYGEFDNDIVEINGELHTTGSVGIGTTSPTTLVYITDGNSQPAETGTQLTVRRDATSGLDSVVAIIAGDTGKSQIDFGDSVNIDIGSIIYNNSGNSMAFTTNTSEAMRIDSSGNVGIGTTGPTALLHLRYPTASADSTMVLLEQQSYGGLSYIPTSTYANSTYMHDIHMSGDTGLKFTVDNGTDALAMLTNGNVGIGTTNPVEKLDIDQGNIHMDQAPTSSGSATGGIVISITVDANATGFGAAMHVDTNGNLIEAKADSTTTMPCFALALEAGTGAGKKVLTQGFAKDTSWSWTVGNPIYVSSATAGALTQTAPATTGDQVQAIGIAMASDTMYFNPDYTMIEIA